MLAIKHGDVSVIALVILLIRRSFASSCPPTACPFSGAVLHSHHIAVNLVTSLFEGQSYYRISHQEMIKGLVGYGYYDELAIPIIENTAHEHELADTLGACIAAHPKTSAVLVRRHGIYVWGATWEQAKRHAECLHYLFEVTIQMKLLGKDSLRPPLLPEQTSLNGHSHVNGEQSALVPVKKRPREDDHVHVNGVGNGVPTGFPFRYVLLDIEGTTTPISFVKDVLFPYASKHVTAYLGETWETISTKELLKEFLKQEEEDARDGLAPPPIDDSSRDNAIRSLSAYVRWAIELDRKIGPLKTLQGRMWAKGYTSGALSSVVYPDVVSFFTRLQKAGIKAAIYSSGSREAQRLLFQYSDQGDLRPFISGYYDTFVGNKREPKSYSEISLCLGLETHDQALFLTDVYEEAVAAKRAGLQAMIVVRPGNAPLPPKVAEEIATVHNFDGLCPE